MFIKPKKYRHRRSSFYQKRLFQATSLITSFLLGQDITKVCISEDETYLLILNVLKAGELKITPKEQSVAINLDNPSCKSYNINSGIDESVLLTLGNVPDHLDAWFVYNDKAIREKLPLDLKSGIDSNFDVCIKPQKDI